tara:strand:- start:234 stop:1682 length:1449 start_codon:yes stop_codon:yes gene_type:complete
MAVLTLDEIRNLDKTGYVVDAGADLVPFLNPVRGLFHVTGDWTPLTLNGFNVPAYLNLSQIPYNHQTRFGLYNVRGKWYHARGAQFYESEDSVPDNTFPYQGPTPFHSRVNFAEISVQHDVYSQLPNSWCEDHDDYLFLVYHPNRRTFYKVTFNDIICALGTDIATSGFNVDIQMPPLPSSNLNADLNGDGSVSVADMLELLQQFGGIVESTEAFIGLHRDAVDPFGTETSDAPNSTSLPVGTYSSTTSFEGNLIPQDWLGTGGFATGNLIDNFEEIFSSNADYAYFDTDVDIVTQFAFNAYAQISVVKVTPGDDYEIDHLKLDDPNFSINVQVDGQPASNNTVAYNKFPDVDIAVDWEREYDKDSYILIGAKVEHIKEDGTVENYYMAGARHIPIGAGTSGTVNSFFETPGMYSSSPLGPDTKFQTTVNTQEWRVFVAVKPYGSPTAPIPSGGSPNGISSAKFTSLKVSGVNVAKVGTVNP